MRKILITGGTGMVGKHLKEILPNATYVGSADCDLLNWREVQYMMFLQKPSRVIHLAGKVGGIQENIEKPAEFFDDNILMNTHMLKASKLYGVERFTGILSTCIYPDVVENYPMTEEDLFLGPPAKSNFSYGYAKRCMAVQIDAYNQQYGTAYNYLIPCNLYSELDNFENGTKMHFITALINKIYKVVENLDDYTRGELKLLGTGKPLRQFMHAHDLARVIKEVIDGDITESFNVAPDYNYTIDEMVRMTLEVLEKDLDVIYENPDLDGQFRKDVSCKKLKLILPNFKFTDFREGIKRAYVRRNYERAS